MKISPEDEFRFIISDACISGIFTTTFAGIYFWYQNPWHILLSAAILFKTVSALSFVVSKLNEKQFSGALFLYFATLLLLMNAFYNIYTKYCRARLEHVNTKVFTITMWALVGCFAVDSLIAILAFVVENKLLGPLLAAFEVLTGIVMLIMPSYMIYALRGNSNKNMGLVIAANFLAGIALFITPLQWYGVITPALFDTVLLWFVSLLLIWPPVLNSLYPKKERVPVPVDPEANRFGKLDDEFD